MIVAMFRLDLKRLWSRWEIWATLFAGTLFAVLGIVESNYVNSMFKTINTIDSPNVSGILGDTQVGGVLFFMIPFLASFPCSWFYYSDCQNHRLPVLLSRLSRGSLLIGRAAAISLSAFFVSVWPYLINFIFSLIAYPFQAYGLTPNSVYENIPVSFRWMENLLWPKLCRNFPILHALLLISLIGLYGMLMALLSYSISLFYRKNMAVTLLLTTVLGFLSVLVLNLFRLSGWVLRINLTTNLALARANPKIVLSEFLILILLNVFLIAEKFMQQKDILE